MKKIIIFILALIAYGTNVNAQSRGIYGTIQSFSTQTSTPYTAALVAKSTPDTTINADTSFLYFSFVNKYDLHFHIVNTKVSGTPAGTFILQMCDDNASWVTCITDKSKCISCTDTVTIANGTTTVDWYMPGSPAKYYRSRQITTGTQSSVANGSAYYKW